MAENAVSPDLIQRVRTGDPDAAAELVRMYEPIIRSRIRIWLRMQDGRLRRVFDSMDVCQSVFASFFVRAAAGQYDLEQPEQLAGLLVQIARHKLSHQVQRQTAQRRDVRRVQDFENGMVSDGTNRPTPSQHAAGKELLEEVRRRLTEDERRIADRRAEGCDWAAIAAELGGKPDALRMRLARALDRVTEELGLNDTA